MTSYESDDIDQSISSDISESEGLKRRSFLKGVASSAVLLPLLGAESVHADATAFSPSAKSPAFLGPGTLLKVLTASGVRAGSLTNTVGTEPVTTARKPFTTNDAYADPGYWFFFHESTDLVIAARIFTTRKSGKKVAFAMMGQRFKRGLEMISSMGTQVFERSGSHYVCRLLAANYFSQKAEAVSVSQHSSPYFISTQQLARVKLFKVNKNTTDKGPMARDNAAASQIDADSMARINAVVTQTASQLGLTNNTVYSLGEYNTLVVGTATLTADLSGIVTPTNVYDMAGVTVNGIMHV